MSDTPTGPVFVVGCQRSGTSALWSALRRHPRLRVGDGGSGQQGVSTKELWFLREYFLGRAHNSDRRHVGSEMDAAFRAEFATLVDRFCREHVAGPSGRWISAHPADGLELDALLEMYPDARVLFLSRHPQEVVWSSLHAPWMKLPDRRALLRQAAVSARHWNAFGRMQRRIEAGELGDRVRVVRHARMLGEPEEVARECLQHVGEDDHPAVARGLGQVFNSSFLESGTEARRVRESRARVQDDPGVCAVVVAECGALMSALGYEDLSAQPAAAAPSSTPVVGDEGSPAAKGNKREQTLARLDEYFRRHPRVARWLDRLLGLRRRARGSGRTPEPGSTSLPSGGTDDRP